MREAKLAAILIAAFLMFGLDGCYTKLKFARPRLAPDAPAADVSYNWEFGYGWYRPEMEIYDSYYGFYYSNWWDECSWCDQYYYSDNDYNSSTESEIDADNGKITRRDNDSYPHHPYQYIIPSANNSQPKADPVPPPKYTQPIESNQTQDNSNKSDDTGKIKKRGRR